MFHHRASFSLYFVLTLVFSLLVVISNIMSIYMIFIPFVALTIPAGLFLYPLTFMISDIVTEIFGTKYAKKIVYIALGVNLCSLVAMEIFLAISPLLLEKSLDLHAAIHLSSLRIFASLTAYTVSQITAIAVYQWLKKLTGEQRLWIRNNGSTCASQLIDTVLIDLIFLYWGLSMPFKEVYNIIFFSYCYKTIFSLSTTPLFYACIALIRKNQAWTIFTRLGKSQSAQPIVTR